MEQFTASEQQTSGNLEQYFAPQMKRILRKKKKKRTCRKLTAREEMIRLYS